MVPISSASKHVFPGRRRLTLRMRVEGYERSVLPWYGTARGAIPRLLNCRGHKFHDRTQQDVRISMEDHELLRTRKWFSHCSHIKSTTCLIECFFLFIEEKDASQDVALYDTIRLKRFHRNRLHSLGLCRNSKGERYIWHLKCSYNDLPNFKGT